jgi:tetratricopeptide (TPR) repeat protein
MKTIQQFKQEIDKLTSTDLLKQVEYYRKNGDQIFAINEALDEGHYNAKTKLVSDYGMTLADNQNYEEAYPILVKAIELWDNLPFKPEEEKKNKPPTYYQHVLLRFAISAYYSKRKPESKKSFETLVDLDPSNQRYRNWLVAIKTEPLTKLSKILGWFFFVILATKILLPKEISYEIGYIYYPIALLLAIAYLVIIGIKWNIKNNLKNSLAVDTNMDISK